MISGLRPGEKLTEVVFSQHDEQRRTQVPGVHLAMPLPLPQTFMVDFLRLEDSTLHNDQVQTYLNLRRVLGLVGMSLIPTQSLHEGSASTSGDGVVPDSQHLFSRND